MVAVAQLAERRVVVPVVVGSKPIRHPSPGSGLIAAEVAGQAGG